MSFRPKVNTNKTKGIRPLKEVLRVGHDIAVSDDTGPTGSLTDFQIVAGITRFSVQDNDDGYVQAWSLTKAIESYVINNISKFSNKNVYFGDDVLEYDTGRLGYVKDSDTDQDYCVWNPPVIYYDDETRTVDTSYGRQHFIVVKPHSVLPQIRVLTSCSFHRNQGEPVFRYVPPRQ